MAIKALGAALSYLNQLFVQGTVSGLPDDELLDRFLATRDGTAFEALMARHGPMVLKVCRAVLRNPSDAEDAFQATFLVLVKKARSLRGHANLGGWLHLVAYRVAIQANAAAARRRVQERRAGEMCAVTSSDEPVIPDELLPALHEEIARLPERLRLAVVLCDLQGVPQVQAAESLRWSSRTLQRRLAEGRGRLKTRLDRRGLGCGGVVLAAARICDAGTVVPPAWQESTLRAALDLVNSTAGAGAVSAAAQSLSHEVIKMMFVRRLTFAAAALLGVSLVAWAASAALVPRGDEPPRTPADAAQRPAPQPAADAKRRDEDGTFPIHGRVFSPDGKPVAGAGVYVRPYVEPGWSDNDPMAARQKGRVASTDADGRFHFDLDKGASDGSYWRGVTGWHKAQIAVAVPGLAPVWVEAGDMVKQGEKSLRLVRDDVPVCGRVLDSQGRPVAGVVVRVRAIWEINDGTDLDAMLASGAVDEGNMLRIAHRYGDSLGESTPVWRADPTPLWPGGRNTWTTGADGGFEVQGIGRDRIARLEFHGGGVADGTLDVMARPAKAPPRARPLPNLRREVAMKARNAAFNGLYPQGTQLVGATFDYIAGPAKPIVGVVRLKGSGKPVEGAIVRGADPGTHTAVTARTDAAGRFRLDGVPKGEFYQIQVNPRQGIDAFLRCWEVINDTEGLKPIEMTIEVPPGVIVIGRLVDKATGRVVPPGNVKYTKAPDNVAAGDALGFSRLADSRFGLTVPPGRGMIAGASAVEGAVDPYVAARLKPADRRDNTLEDRRYTFDLVGSHAYRFIDVPAGSGPLTVDLELARGPSRMGRLIGPDGQRVVGADAYGLSARDWAGTVSSRPLDADTFEVAGLESGHPRLLVFTHKARKLVGAAVLKDEDLKSNTPLEVKLVPAGAITGRLIDEDGLPWAGAMLRVWMTDPGGSPSHGCSFGEEVTADAQGRFQVDAFAPGVELEVSIRVPDRGNVPLDGGDALRKPALKPGELRDLGDVKVKEISRQ